MDNSVNSFNNEISQDGCKQLLVLLIDIEEFPEVNSSHFVRWQWQLVISFVWNKAQQRLNSHHISYNKHFPKGLCDLGFDILKEKLINLSA